MQYLDENPLGHAIADDLNKMAFGFGVRRLRLHSFRVAGEAEVVMLPVGKSACQFSMAHTFGHNCSSASGRKITARGGSKLRQCAQAFCRLSIFREP